jgi:hypothetical protein
MNRMVRRESSIRLHHAPQVAAHQRDIGGFHRDVRAGADRHSQVGLRQR